MLWCRLIAQVDFDASVDWELPGRRTCSRQVSRKGRIMKKAVVLVAAAAMLSMAACSSGGAGVTGTVGAGGTSDADAAIEIPAENTEATTLDSSVTEDDVNGSYSSDSTSSADPHDVAPSTGAQDSAGSTRLDVEPIPAFEAFNTKSIWFSVDERFAKNSHVWAVFAFDGNGNVTVYNHVDQFDFSMINASMSDEEVLEVVKSVEMEERRLLGIDGEPQPQSINLRVFTDDSGNITEEEQIGYINDDKGLTDGATIWTDLVTDYEIQPIYDMQFAGYTTFKRRITDTDSYVGYNLDAANTAGITVY